MSQTPEVTPEPTPSPEPTPEVTPEPTPTPEPPPAGDTGRLSATQAGSSASNRSSSSSGPTTASVVPLQRQHPARHPHDVFRADRRELLDDRLDRLYLAHREELLARALGQRHRRFQAQAEVAECCSRLYFADLLLAHRLIHQLLQLS